MSENKFPPNYVSVCTDLSDMGYCAIPIQQNSVPCVKYTHLNEPVPLDIVDEWVERFTNANVALYCGVNDVYAIDIDVDDSGVVRELLKQIKAMGITDYPLRRVKRKGHVRCAVIFRADETLAEVSNAKSAVFRNGLESNQIELVGNKLLTVYGLHRKHQLPYVWKTPLTSIHSDDLPIITRQQVQRLFDVFEHCMLNAGYETTRREPSWSYRADRSSSSSSGSHTPFDKLVAKRVYSDEEVTELLRRIDGTSRENWLNVGMALHAHYNGDYDGFRRWDEWSSQFDGYVNTDDCRTAWRHFHTDGGVTMGTVNHIVKQNESIGKPKEDKRNPLEFAIDNYVFIASTNEVGDLSKRVNESVMALPHMKTWKCNVRVPIPKGDTIVQAPLVTAWLNHQDRKSAYTKEYIPINKRIIHGEDMGGGRDERYYNTYVPPNVNVTSSDDLLPYFLNHIDYVFASNPQWFINWLAQIIQEPMKRFRVVPYSIATHTGTGRGVLVKLLNKLLGLSNVTTIKDMSELNDHRAKNGYLNQSLLLCINETEAPGKVRYEVGERLKTIVSDDYQAVDIKYGEQSFNKRIYTRVFMQSNSLTNLVIDRNDNRIQPFINLSPPKSNEYYTTLHNLVDTNQSFLDQVYSYLLHYPLNREMLQEAIMTDEKRMLIEATSSVTASAFHGFLQIVDGDCFTASQLNQYLTTQIITVSNLGENEIMVNRRELSHLLRDHVHFRKAVVAKGNRVEVMAQEVKNRFTVSNDELKRSVNASQQKLIEHYSAKEHGNGVEKKKK